MILTTSTCSSTIPHKTPAYTAETIQVLYFDFTKATVLVSLPLDLITLLAPVLLEFFIPDSMHCTLILLVNCATA